MHVPNNSSYDTDTSMYFLDFIKKYPKRATNENVSVVTEDCPSFLYLSECEGNALYNLAGWAVFKEKNSCKTCQTCIVGDASNGALEHAQLTILKSYSQGSGLCHPSPAILNAIVALESIFKSNEAKFANIENLEVFLLNAFLSQFVVSGFPRLP